MFDFYLTGSEFSFRHLGLINWQLQLTRRVGTLPLSRDYMFEQERAERPFGRHEQQSSLLANRVI